jgi:hypothetical protein
MPEQEVVTSPWLYYALGYLGIALYVLRGAMKVGLTLDVFGPFLKSNALAIIATFITYNGILGMWMYSDALSFFGLQQGELSGMTVPVAFMCNEIFADFVDRQKTKLQEKRDAANGTPPPTA